jgi:hypothetical protein
MTKAKKVASVGLVPAAVAETPGPDIRFYETKVVPLVDLRPNAWNPNSMNAAKFARLKQEILDVGFIEPLVVVPWKTEEGAPFFRILGGEHRFRAAIDLKLKGVPCNILDHPMFQDEEVQQAMNAKLIFLKGDIDRDKMVAMVKGLAEKYSSEKVRELFAVTDKTAWDHMVWGMRQKLKKEGLPEKALTEFDEKTKDVRASKDLSEIVEAIFTTYRHTLPYGFMVFTLHGKKHTYVPVTQGTQTVIDDVLERCRASGVDINKLLEPAFKDALKQLKAPDVLQAVEAPLKPSTT